MTSFGAGKRWVLSLVALAFSVKAPALERQAWVFEQLGTLPAATKKDETRYQAGAQATNYSDNLSTMGFALLDLREFELVVRASQRLIGALTKDDQSSASVELARNYVGDTGIFGRSGVEVFHFFPSTRRWAKIGIATGKIGMPAQPWDVTLSTNVFISLSGYGAHLCVRGETHRSLGDGSPFSLGGFLNWNYRLRAADSAGRFEHMLFSFGPLLEWRTGFGILRAQAPLRLWVDRDLYLDNGTLVTAMPLELSPDLALSLTIIL